MVGGLGVERGDVVGMGGAVDAEIFLGRLGVVGFCAVGSGVYHLTIIYIIRKLIHPHREPNLFLKFFIDDFCSNRSNQNAP